MPLIPSSSRGGAASRADRMFTGAGLITANASPLACQNTVAPAAGTMVASMVGLNAGDQITNIILCNNIAGSGAAPTLIKVGVYDINNNLVASSVDSHASAIWTAVGYIVAPLSAIYSVPSDGAYYFAFLKVGSFVTTQPTFLAYSSNSQVGKQVGTSPRIAFQQAGLSDLPNPAVPADSSGNALFFGAS